MAPEPAGGARPSGAERPDGRLRVMQITDNLGVGGLERVVATLASALDPERFEPSVLCLRWKGALAAGLEERGIPVVVVAEDPDRPDYFAFRPVARILRRMRIDVVHTHNTNPMVNGTLGAKLAGVPTVVHTDHARDFPDKLRYMVAEHLLSHLVYRVVGVSDHTTRNLRRYERISPRKLRTIENGIDPAPFETPIDVAAKRREIGVPPGALVVGLGARLTPQKGIDVLLEAFARLRRDDVHLVIAGKGESGAELRALARELGVAERVRFLGERLDLPALMRTFDVYLLPSRWEGLPMAVLEAMAASRAILATDVGGVGRAVRDGETGVLVPPEAPDALAAALNALLDDPARRLRLGGAARALFDRRFSAATMARAYERLYLREDG